MRDPTRLAYTSIVSARIYDRLLMDVSDIRIMKIEKKIPLR
jgi:hypothetical protein